MLPGMERVVARVNGIRLVYYRAGRGFPMVLLHGWPQTSYAWRKVVGPLGRRFSLIVPDLRGLGGSDRPLAGYDMRTVSSDIRGLVQGLGSEKVILVGHDWGGIVGRRLALDSPALLERLVIVDVVPHEQVLSHIPPEAAFGGAWHFFFNAQPDLPEILVQGRVEAFLRFWFRSKVYDPDVLGPEDIAEYVDAYSRPGALRAGFNYYRAMRVENRALDARDDGRKIPVPTLIVYGTDGGVGAAFPVVEMWQQECEDLEVCALERCGHLVPEERPDRLVEEILRFCKDLAT